MESFDDPNLKTALRRACGCDAAPKALREKIQSLACGKSSPRGWFGRPMTWGAAVAASVLIAVGVYLNTTRALPVDVAGSMIKTHDRCSALADHIFIKGDYTVIGAKLATDLKVPVLSTSLQGWTFDGAGECPVWGHPSAHLLYRRGNQVLSIFTLPGSDFALAPGNQSFNNSTNGHYLASFTRGNGLYCIVESSTDGSARPADVSQIRDQLLQTFNASAVPAPTARLALALSPR